jgi:hypothetical protein
MRYSLLYPIRPCTAGIPFAGSIPAAAVFLARDCAYKVKRAVRFPFLDYSTLERRKLACEAELDVNRPFAPEIYRRVTPITRETDGALKLGGTSQPVERAVEMERFNEDNTLDHLTEHGLIDMRLASALASLRRRLTALRRLSTPHLGYPRCRSSSSRMT